jgi:hypothetical protein
MNLVTLGTGLLIVDDFAHVADELTKDGALFPLLSLDDLCRDFSLLVDYG